MLELKVTDISYGAVSSSVFDISPPPDAKVTDVNRARPRRARHRPMRPAGHRLQAVQRQTSFAVAAPDTLAGLPRNEVRLIQSGKDAGALVTYGQGLGGIAVIERPAESRAGNGAPRRAAIRASCSLPKVSINGAQGEELETALGTMVRFQRDGVEYTVIASAPPATVQTAARDL